MCHRALSYTLSWLLCLKSHWDGGISLLVPIFLTLPRFCMHVHCLMLQFFKIFVIHQNHNYTGRGSSNCIPESYLPAFLVSAPHSIRSLFQRTQTSSPLLHETLRVCVFMLRVCVCVCVCTAACVVWSGRDA